MTYFHNTTLLFILGLLILLLTHLFGYRLKFVNSLPRSKWLSLCGGISVAYIFIHLLPEIEHYQREIASETMELFIYIAALTGLVIFYGLERLIWLKHKKNTTAEDIENSSSEFWLHIISFALYNFLVGYLLLRREDADPFALALYVVAMSFHFLVNDFGLVQHHGDLYRHYGRWIISAGIAIGAIVGYFVPLQALVIALLFSFLAGSTILNVLKEELPDQGKSNFKSFVAGAVLYTAIILLEHYVE